MLNDDDTTMRRKITKKPVLAFALLPMLFIAVTYYCIEFSLAFQSTAINRASIPLPVPVHSSRVSKLNLSIPTPRNVFGRHSINKDDVDTNILDKKIRKVSTVINSVKTIGDGRCNFVVV